VVKCSLCQDKAIVKIPYAGLRLCKEHFTKYIEDRVRKTIKRYNLISSGMRVLVAVSGGKDSSTMLVILNKLSKELKFTLYAMHIDLGIGNYSVYSRRTVEKLSQSLNIPLIILEVKKILGYGIPEIASKAKRPACSVCGVIKRYLINATALELGADVVAMGHNLDDIITYAFKEFMNQNLNALAKLGPSTKSIKDLAVSRIRPLYEIYERESLLYALINNITFVKDECPMAREDSLDRIIKVKYFEIEERYPGIKLAFVRRFAKNIQYYQGTEPEFKKCKTCGLLSSWDICSYCRLSFKILGKYMGHDTRNYIRELLKNILIRT